MSLTSGFARLVLLAGHGASVVNNPHASALAVRRLRRPFGRGQRPAAGRRCSTIRRCGRASRRGIAIPDDTLFVGALHDTTTDEVTLYADDHPLAAHARGPRPGASLARRGGQVARGERALRLPRAARRGATSCAGPRLGRDAAGMGARRLQGLHRRAARAHGRARPRRTRLPARLRLAAGPGFGVLELIMTAPVVVASWISLQYYGSTVAPDAFGGGNKLLHNVVGGIGVVEGNGGVLRVGLPWQSVHDGERYVHEPLRLSVCIEAPREAIDDDAAPARGVRALFDNGWLHLFALDDAGPDGLALRRRPAWTAMADPAMAARQPPARAAVRHARG